MTMVSFPDRPRVDARDKVLGRTRYAADEPMEGMLYAMPVPSRIAKGRIVALDTGPASRVPGVVRVLTTADFPAPEPRQPSEAERPPTPAKTITDEIGYRGQPIALVVAASLEAAIEGAEAVRATYAEEDAAATMEQPGAKREPGENTEAGDANSAMSAAAATIDQEYLTPAQHHNPIEMLSTTAVWADGRLTVHEGTQNSGGMRAGLAAALGLDPAIVDVKSPTIGGGFGQKAGPQRQSALAARAAMLTGRPVKIVVPRGLIFHNATFRPESRHRIRLGADASGKMVAAQYDAEQQNSREGTFPLNYHESVSRLYGIENYFGTTANVRIDTQPPGHMRAPFQHSPCFAFESAVDELAYELGRDPLAFRLANDATRDPIARQPLSSRFMAECLREGAERFGWSRRTPEPASMTLPDGTQVGFGVACGIDPTFVSPTIATLRVDASGATRLAMSGHEMGQGIRTAIAAVLTTELDIDPDKLEIVIGDTAAAPQHTTAGSWGTASAAPAVQNVARRLRERLDELPGARGAEGNLHQRLARARRPSLEVTVSHVGPGQGPEALDKLRQGQLSPTGPEHPGFTTFAYVAHFVEVHVEPRTRRIRMPRSVSIVDCGRVVSPRTAASQVRGGIVWAFGACLREASEVDPRFGGFLNADLADYVVPVNADIGTIDIGFINKPDPLINESGIKCLGEVVMAGAAAAIANAVFHATGKRVRRAPIRIEDLL